MKIGQINVLFAVTRSKMKRRVTYKDSFKDIMKYSFLFCPSIFSEIPRCVKLEKQKNDTLAEPFGLAKQKLYYCQMLLNREEPGKEDKERSEE